MLGELNILDWLIVAFAVLLAMRGLSAGFLASLLSLAGVVAGAFLGSRLAPALLSGETLAPYGPLISIAGALIFAAIGEAAARSLGDRLRRRLKDGGLVAALDGLGGALFGAAMALIFAWIAGVLILQAPLSPLLHNPVQRSEIFQRLDERLPSQTLLQTFARLDPLPELDGPDADVAPPDAAILQDLDLQTLGPSVVRVSGIACGVGVEGSGWVAAPGLVVTNAHVVAGEEYTSVQPGGAGQRLDAEVVLFDVRNDIAVLRVPGLDLPSLPTASPIPGEPVAILGYPGNGPFDVRPGRLGNTHAVISSDFYGRGPVQRQVTSIRGLVRQGNSGGPVVNARGEVVATVFASRADGERVGYGIPSPIVEDLIATALQNPEPADTGPCAA
ncbi:MarP family serine protease [Rubrobacter taiwanensis]|jgi:S1-C subfamily serine protease|uniref:MarP family serine protease n=1 Tax=Rubrobacter taiwanensis TaxID=185139 RepID=A0A4R1BSN2_9ACTN|nr:MarP family serine protease [Rubrobacter taiwanensis]TCJ20296.1 MarP family serine protease [Rubrobacter taiwanensis]